MMLIAKKATPRGLRGVPRLRQGERGQAHLLERRRRLGLVPVRLLLKSTLQTEFTMVPYKGTGPAMNDLIGGQVDFMCDQSTNTMPQIKSGNVKVYGVTTAARLASLPDLPTLDEQGLKGFELVVWNGLFAPKGTPKPVLDRLVAALQAAVRDPAFGTRLADLGAEPVPVAKATRHRCARSSGPRSTSGPRSSARVGSTRIESQRVYAD